MNEIKYDSIGINYNNTRVADPYLAQRLFDLLRPEIGKQYLDIGCGTGNYTTAIAAKGMLVTGIDPSDLMLEVARLKAENVNFIKGVVEEIPFPNGYFDGIIATLTIHHWHDLTLAFNELGRILNAEGKIVIFTSTPAQMTGYWLNHYFPQMLQNSILQMPSTKLIESSISGSDLKIASLEKYFVKDDLKDHFLYVGKNRPELYLNQNVRAGISSFSSLSNAPEIEAGLKKLQEDLENGNFQRIKDNYENENGDYLFMVIVKN